MNSAIAKTPRSSLLPFTEFALLLTTSAAVFGLIRIFSGLAFLKTLLIAAVGSHLLALLARRARLALLPATLVSLLGGAITIGMIFYRTTMRFGLPTVRTWNLAFEDQRAAIKLFATTVPPVKPEAGFFLAAVIATWMVAFFADTLAYRAKVSIEAMLPSGVLFVFASALAAPRHRLACTLLWLVTVLLFVALHRAMKEAQSAGWLSGHRRGASHAFVKGGVVLGASAIFLGGFIGPRLPGAGQKALVHTRNSGSSDVFALSPFVNIKKQLSTRSAQELFTVKSDVQSYWRAIALSDFDGNQWNSDLNQGSTKGGLGQPRAGIPQRTITADFAISALGETWVPAPFLPVALNKASFKGKTKFDKDTATLMVSGDLKKGDAYEIVAKTPDVTPEILRTAAEPTSFNKKYLALPADYPPELVTLANEVTKDATNEFDRARALQDWFQNTFVYDLGVPSGQTTNDIRGFIESKRGYCEQFSATYAAFARSLGIPARVAEGFTSGVLKDDGLYHVQALHAHAWPEVFFEGVGWLAFEPTPGRGNPTAATYTGVAPQQAGETSPPVATTVVTTTIPRAAVSPSTTTPFRIPKEATATEVVKAKPSLWKRYHTVLLGLIVLAVLAAYPFVLSRIEQARWSRRRKRARYQADQLAVSWQRTTDVLSQHATPPLGGETPLAFANRATTALRIPSDWLPGLAEAVTRSTYAGTVPSDAQLRDAERIPLQTRHLLRQRATARQRILARLDPRVIFRALPGDAPRVRRFG